MRVSEVVEITRILLSLLWFGIFKFLTRRSSTLRSKKETSGRSSPTLTPLGTDELLAWELTDYHNHQPVCNIVAHFEGQLDIATVKQKMKEKVIPHMKFHSVPKPSRAGSSEDLPLDSDELAKPLQPIRWKAMEGEPERWMEDMISEHCFDSSEAMDDFIQARVNSAVEVFSNTRPWWRLALLKVRAETQQHQTTANCHLLFRIHHCLGDGVSIVQALGDVVTDKEGNPVDLTKVFNPRNRVGAGGNTGMEMKRRGSFLTRFWNLAALLIRIPLLLLDAVWCIKEAVDTMQEPPDSTSAFHDGSKSLPVKNDWVNIWPQRYSVEHCKKLKNRLNELKDQEDSYTGISTLDKWITAAKGMRTAKEEPFSLNDVQYALYSGAIRRYVAHFGANPDKFSMRSFTPLALPNHNLPKDPQRRYMETLRNCWILIKTSIPIREENALGRVRAAHQQWSSVKNSMAVPVGFFLGEYNAQQLSLRQWRDLNKKLGTEVTLMFSNVPGPTDVYGAGCRLTGVHCAFANLPHQACIVSVDGYFNIAATSLRDEKLPKGEQERLFNQFYIEELQELCTLLGFENDARNIRQFLKPKY